MSDYYWIDLYVEMGDIDIDDLVTNTLNALIGSGCKLKALEKSRAENEETKFEDQEFKVERIDVGLTEAIHNCAEDVKSWIDVKRKDKEVPGVKLIFDCDFKLGDVSKDSNIDKKDPVDPKEIDLSFWYGEDLLFYKIVIISIHIDMIQVLNHENEENYNYNKSKILEIAKNVSEHVNPFFGWMDYEENSVDRSYQLIVSGKYPDANDYVIVGNKLIDRINKDELEKNKKTWRSLHNGGLLIKGANNKDDLSRMFNE